MEIGTKISDNLFTGRPDRLGLSVLPENTSQHRYIVSGHFCLTCLGLYVTEQAYVVLE